MACYDVTSNAWQALPASVNLFPASINLRMPTHQGLTLAHFKAQLEDLRDTSLTLERNLSTIGPHPRVSLGYMGDKVGFS